MLPTSHQITTKALRTYLKWRLRPPAFFILRPFEDDGCDGNVRTDTVSPKSQEQHARVHAPSALEMRISMSISYQEHAGFVQMRLCCTVTLLGLMTLPWPLSPA